MGPKRKQGNDEAQQTLLGFFQSPSHSSTPSTSENDLSPSKSTTFRNRLNIDTQHCLMMLKLDSHSRLTFNFDLALLKWKKTKDRRLYELKYKQK